MLGKRIINTATDAGAACTTDTVQILDGVPFQSIATYQLDGNANDLTTNYNGTASNVTYATGKFGNAADFNGSSSYITASNPFSGQSGAGQTYSISLWFKADSFAKQYPTLFKGRSTGETPPYVWTNGSIIRFHGYRYGDATVSLNTGQWYHLVVIENNGVLSGYLDGSSITFANQQVWNQTNGSTFLIGGDPNSNVYYFDGLIDQVRIYNKAISAANVATLYAETVATASTNPVFNVPSCIAYYKMNDATDETGSYDGTPTNVNFNVAGKFGNAASFNGSSSYIDLGVNNFKLNTLAISLWVNVDSFVNNQVIYGGYTEIPNQAGGILIRTNSSGNVLFDGWNPPSTYGGKVTSTSALSTNTWYHLVFSITQSEVKIYIDGSLDKTGSISGFGYHTNHQFALSSLYSYGGSPVAFFNGSLDQVRIFDRAITATEVTTLYNEVQCIPTIVPTDHFEPVLYTGNGTAAGVANNIVGLGFQPDLVWVKNRGAVAHNGLFDVARGVGEILYSNLTNPEASAAGYHLSSFNTDGFTMEGNSNVSNLNGNSYVAWNWKAGGAAVSNTDGTITSQVSANVDAGFSVVTFTSPSTTNQIFGIGHGLTNTPKVIITKERDGILDWITYHESLGTGAYLRLNTTDASGTFPTQVWGDTAPNDSTFEMKTSISVNTNKQLVAYCFAEVDGYSKFGSYTGTGANVNIVTGFRPATIMIKRTDNPEDWKIIDNKRGDFANSLEPNESIAEEINNNSNFQSHSNGFTIGDTHGDYNANGGSYIFMAFAEENVQPEPELANSFNTVLHTPNNTGNNISLTGVGFQPDFVWMKYRYSTPVTGQHYLFNSVTGDSILKSASTQAEISSGYVKSFDQDGVTYLDTLINRTGADSVVAWCWKASNDSTINQDGSITSIVSANPAAGFSISKFNIPNSGSSVTVGHGLSSAPQLLIVKTTDKAGSWFVYNESTGASKEAYLELSNAWGTDVNRWANTSPNSTSFTLGSSWLNATYSGEAIAYAFHSVAGYQKIGSYSGDSTSGRLIQTDFAVSWVMIKTTNAPSNWFILDSERGGTNDLRANSSNAEEARANGVTFVSNGFELDDTSVGFNNTGTNYIYLAIKAN